MNYVTEKEHLVQQEPPKIRSMREATERLLRLLKDPQPGLFTWQEAVHATLRTMAKQAGYSLTVGGG